MSTELVAINNALQVGGVGLGSGLFKAKVSFMELVQKTSRVEGAIPGQFRDCATNTHYPEVRIVLLDVPREQRDYFDNTRGLGFTKEAKICHSWDNYQPAANAKEPQAMFCSQCPKGDLAWATWRTNKIPENLPKCQMHYSIIFADRNTQQVFKMQIKGKSVLPFKNYMESAVAGLLQKILADVRAKNKQRGYAYDKTKGCFVPIEGAAPTEAPLLLPSLFDLSMTMHSTTLEKGGVPTVAFKDVKLMDDDSKAEFGALYQEFVASRQQDAATAEVAEQEAEQVATILTEAPSASPVVLPGVVQGTVVDKNEPITI